MATDPWMIDASGGAPAYTAQEARLLLVTPLMAGAGASLGVRTGVRPSGSGTDLLVQAQGSPNMSVLVNTGVITVQGAISTTQGGYTWALDTATTLTIAAAHATLSRTDLVCVRIRDAGVDTSGQRDASVIVITGTAGAGVPSLPTDATYYTIAQISVPAAVTTITTGRITDKRTFTAALGGVIYCPTSAEEPAASSVPKSQLTYRADLDMFRRTDGTNWFGAMPYRQVRTTTAGQSSVTFSGIPTSLRVITIDWIARGDTAAAAVAMRFRINNDATVGSYRSAQMFSLNGAAPQAGNALTGQDSALAGNFPAANAAAAHYGTGELKLNGWNNINSMVGYLARAAYAESNGGSIAEVEGGEYFPTGPYNRVDMFPGVGGFATNGQFVLTGIE